ncbi:hypothetical protein BKA67DRAFT_663460 [Truncatella angustata]|uniref:Uncharacterized protein n=1 Tax=Truncatella angustata TaxID=152316 RepID=A0A9P8RJS5_9PEZI|nr:uncharacterized protein BKA67DRAFT_663460 [Truncatella angustata]KAH6647114.1 hypothetical protein BKA67DRAFT_663460 [Truncatella angustata]
MTSHASQAQNKSPKIPTTESDVRAPPTTSPTASGSNSRDDFAFSGLFPGKTYVILEKISSRAITSTGDGLCLEDIEDDSDEWNQNNRWLCVESNGYLALQDVKSGKYMGHDGKQNVCAQATKLGGWECITTRDHPNGGYQLLSPHWLQSLMAIVVAEDGKSLVRRQHGTTLWRFVKVSD